MTNTEFVLKVRECNSSIPHRELLQASFKTSITRLRDLSNLDLILTDKKVKEFNDAEDLIFYIESKSRALDVKQARLRRLKRQRNLDNLIDSYNKRFLEEMRLSKATTRALGFETNKDNICRACGHMPTARGNCNC